MKRPCPHCDGTGVTDSRSIEPIEQYAGIHLSPQLGRLLRLLIEHEGKVATRRFLLAELYPPYSYDRSIDQLMKKLRKLLAGTDIRIETVHGYGYKLLPRATKVAA